MAIMDTSRINVGSNALQVTLRRDICAINQKSTSLKKVRTVWKAGISLESTVKQGAQMT